MSHANRLIAGLNERPDCHAIQLEKVFSQTEIAGQGVLDQPAWHWPD